ncbi:MAG: sigma-70 family RNA polymerase sigma factor [Alkalinema sp. RU_4_3]|nr:sigma-70 family RNA polymerase sigma factor [Alkalinema sp. RU_4_3]
MTQRTELSDPKLIEALQRHDRNALSAIYDRYSGLVYKIALKMLHQEESAADLTQEVFLELWKRPERYQSDRGSIGVFLSVMTRSRALNRIRTAKSQQNLLQRAGRNAMTESTANPNLEQATLSELSSMVTQALQQIPEAQRQVLEMAYYEGLSQSDITEKTGIPLGTVKSRSRQGLLKLRDLLKDLA